jgi:acyl dehydratase
MPIDPSAALAAPAVTAASSWDADRVILYHLGVGAGASPTDPDELRYVYEPQLVVLPTFSMVVAAAASTSAVNGPGLEYDPGGLLQVGQDLEVHQPLRASGTAVSAARVEAVWDKGRAAVFVVAVETTADDGSLLCRNRLTLYARGAGGFGGDPGPPTHEPPASPPAAVLHEMHVPTIGQLAAIFRLTGDRTPLHIDPVAARAAGLGRPTLPGLCTWGIACKALVSRLLSGDPARVRRFSVRFTGPIHPGETIGLRWWEQDGADRPPRAFAFDAHVVERDAPLLDRGLLVVG